jgi:hypothetical protein
MESPKKEEMEMCCQNAEELTKVFGRGAFIWRIKKQYLDTGGLGS